MRLCDISKMSIVQAIMDGCMIVSRRGHTCPSESFGG